jgi:hypothetical protein
VIARLAALCVSLALASPGAPGQFVYVGTPGSFGCGPAGIPPTLIGIGSPQIGTRISLSVTAPSGLQWAVAPLLAVGTPASLPVGPPFCPPGPGGCTLLFNPVGSLIAPMPAGPGSPTSYSLSVALPNDPGLVGIVILGFQAGGLLTGSSCISLTNGLVATLLL